MFVQEKNNRTLRKTTALYSGKISLPHKIQNKKQILYSFLTHPHCMWTNKLCAEVFTNQEITEVLHKHFTPCLVDEHTDPELYILMNQSIRVFLKDQNTRPGCLFTHQTGEPFWRRIPPSFSSVWHAISSSNSSISMPSESSIKVQILVVYSYAIILLQEASLFIGAILGTKK